MTSTEFVLLLAAGALVWAAGYFAACAFWPYAACRKCDGSGRHRSPSGRAFRFCRQCKGGGRRVRTGRRVWIWLSGKASDAT